MTPGQFIEMLADSEFQHELHDVAYNMKDFSIDQSVRARTAQSQHSHSTVDAIDQSMRARTAHVTAQVTVQCMPSTNRCAHMAGPGGVLCVPPAASPPPLWNRWRSGGPFAEPLGGLGGVVVQLEESGVLIRRTTTTPNMRLPHALKFLVRGVENAQGYCALETINYITNTRYSAVAVQSQSQYSHSTVAVQSQHSHTVTAQSQHCYTVTAQSQHCHSTVAALSQQRREHPARRRSAEALHSGSLWVTLLGAVPLRPCTLGHSGSLCSATFR